NRLSDSWATHGQTASASRCLVAPETRNSLCCNAGSRARTCTTVSRQRILSSPLDTARGDSVKPSKGFWVGELLHFASFRTGFGVKTGSVRPRGKRGHLAASGAVEEVVVCRGGGREVVVVRHVVPQEHRSRLPAAELHDDAFL